MPGYDGRQSRMAPIARSKGVTSFEASSAPLEHLVFNDKLVLKDEVADCGAARAEAAYSYREDMEKAEIAGLGAQVISDANGGGGNRATLSEHKLFAMQSLGELKDTMGKREYQLLERLVWKDEWVFLVPEPKTKPKTKAQARARRQNQEKARRRAMEDVLKVLDLAAVHYGLITMADYRARWVQARRPKSTAPSPAAGRNPPTKAKARRAPQT